MRLINRLPTLLGLVIIFTSAFYLYERRNVIENGKGHSIDYWHRIRNAAEEHIPRLNPQRQKPLSPNPHQKTNETAHSTPVKPVTDLVKVSSAANSTTTSAAESHHSDLFREKQSRPVAHSLDKAALKVPPEPEKAAAASLAPKIKQPGTASGSGSNHVDLYQASDSAPVKSGISFSGVKPASEKGRQYNGPRRNSLPMPYPAGMLS